MMDELKRLSRFTVGSEGNVSYRTEHGFAVKQSGTTLEDGLFVHCDTKGQPYPNICRDFNGDFFPGTHYDKPSMESSFHSLIYQRSDYKFIAHTHPTNVMKLLCGPRDQINIFATRRLFPDHAVFNGSTACIVPYATPGEELTEQIRLVTMTQKPFPPLLLLQNHGIICCGHTMKQVVIATEICEKAAEIFLGTDNPSFLSSEQVASILGNPNEIYRKSLLA